PKFSGGRFHISNSSFSSMDATSDGFVPSIKSISPFFNAFKRDELSGMTSKIMLPSFGLSSSQQSSFLSSTILLSFSHSENSNGPVPAGSLAKSSPLSSKASGLPIANGVIAKFFKNGAK